MPWHKVVTVGSTGPDPVDLTKTPADNLALTDSVDAVLVLGSSAVFGGNFGGTF